LNCDLLSLPSYRTNVTKYLTFKCEKTTKKKIGFGSKSPFDDRKKQKPLHYCFRGDVVTMECVEKIIKKDWCHPLTGEKLKEQDIILLQRVIAFLQLL
jgi:hypothetical protein